MTISIKCTCGQVYQLADQFAGKAVRCKVCQQTFKIPGAAASAQQIPQQQPANQQQQPKRQTPQGGQQPAGQIQGQATQQAQPNLQSLPQAQPGTQPPNQGLSPLDANFGGPGNPQNAGFAQNPVLGQQPVAQNQLANPTSFGTAYPQAAGAKPQKSKLKTEAGQRKLLISLIAVFGVGTLAGCITLIMQLSGKGDAENQNQQVASNDSGESSNQESSKKQNQPNSATSENNTTSTKNNSKTTTTPPPKTKSPTIIQNGLTYKRLPPQPEMDRGPILKWTSPKNKNMTYKFKFKMERGQESQQLSGTHRIKVTDRKPDEFLPTGNQHGVYMKQHMCTVIHPSGIAVATHRAVKGNSVLRIGFSSNLEETKVIAATDHTECVLLQVPGDDLPAIPLAPPDELQTGETVYIVGDLTREAGGETVTETVQKGIISESKRDECLIESKNITGKFGMNGSAIVNDRGQLVAVLQRTLRIDGKLFLVGRRVNTIYKLLKEKNLTVPISNSTKTLDRASVSKIAKAAVLPFFNYDIHQIKFVEFETEFDVDINGITEFRGLKTKGDILTEGTGKILKNRIHFPDEDRIVSGVESYNMIYFPRLGFPLLVDYSPDGAGYGASMPLKYSEFRKQVAETPPSNSSIKLTQVPDAKLKYFLFQHLTPTYANFIYKKKSEEGSIRTYELIRSGRNQTPSENEDFIYDLRGEFRFDMERGCEVGRELSGYMEAAESGQRKRYNVTFSYSLAK